MQTDIQNPSHRVSNSAIYWMQIWLILLGLLVYSMILVGGATRLTDSGLSITEWKPISGTLPPLSSAEWITLFDLYKETAEYKFQNAGMTMSEFQFIYWWEWGHRFLGRFVGLVAVVGFTIFWLRGWLQNGLKLKFAGLIVLGGLQGAIGWWMVASGIGETTRVDVAPYRLMTHFGLALVIICYIFWLWSDLASGVRRLSNAKKVFFVLFGLVFLQMLAGALVAGLDAGRTYTDWPLMAGEFVPAGYFETYLGWRNPFENVAMTQFHHRVLAYFIAAYSLWVCFAYRRRTAELGLGFYSTLLLAQVLWGIYTLVSVAPLSLALVHQGLGVLVLLASLRVCRKSAAQSSVS